MARQVSTAEALRIAKQYLDTGHRDRAAGILRQLLANRDGQSLAAIKKSIPAPGDIVVAAVGWLAREGKLEFLQSGRTLKISLKP